MLSDDLMPDLLQELPAEDKPPAEEAGEVIKTHEEISPVRKKEREEETRIKPSGNGGEAFLKPPFTCTLSISLDSGLKNNLQNGLNQMLNAGDYRYGDLSDLIREALSLYFQGILKPAPHPHSHKGRRVQMTLRLNDRFKALVKERMPKKTRCILVDRILRAFHAGHMEYRPSSQKED